MAEFVKPFDCKNEKHVMWLKHLGGTMAKSLGGDKKINMAAAIDDNPLPGQPHVKNVMDFPYVHFQLAMKYANAVLSEEAWVPKTK